MPLPALRPYAQKPLRLLLQVLADLIALAWIAGWVWLGQQVRSGLLTLGSAGFALRDGAGGVSASLAHAGANVRKAPMVGDALAAPLGSAGSAAGQVSGAGSLFGDRLTGAALPLAIVLAVLGVLPVALPWLTARIRYARRAGASRALLRRPGGERLLALRALTGRRPSRVLALAPDPLAAWEAGDPEVTRALARLELRALGLRPPRLIRQTRAHQAGVAGGR